MGAPLVLFAVTRKLKDREVCSSRTALFFGVAASYVVADTLEHTAGQVGLRNIDAEDGSNKGHGGDDFLGHRASA